MDFVDSLDKIFEGILPQEKINLIKNNYNNFADMSLVQLGVDSLSIMGLVLKIQSIYNMEIDFENFNIFEIETLNKIKVFISKQ